MKTIIIATDFSAAAENAANYTAGYGCGDRGGYFIAAHCRFAHSLYRSTRSGNAQ
jgi:hypothetical protein